MGQGLGQNLKKTEGQFEGKSEKKRAKSPSEEGSETEEKTGKKKSGPQGEEKKSALEALFGPVLAGLGRFCDGAGRVARHGTELSDRKQENPPL